MAALRYPLALLLVGIAFAWEAHRPLFLLLAALVLLLGRPKTCPRP